MTYWHLDVKFTLNVQLISPQKYTMCKQTLNSSVLIKVTLLERWDANSQKPTDWESRKKKKIIVLLGDGVATEKSWFDIECWRLNEIYREVVLLLTDKEQKITLVLSIPNILRVFVFKKYFLSVAVTSLMLSSKVQNDDILYCVKYMGGKKVVTR